MIQLHDKHFVPYLTAAEIERTVVHMAADIEAGMGDETPVFLVVLNGAFMFAGDLLKNYKKPCVITFVKLASYEGMQSSNNVKQLIGLDASLEGRTVIVVEDIVDTDTTVEKLKEILEGHKVKQFKIATLFFKPEAYRKTIMLDYTGFNIPNKFIVGYGLDYDGLGRNLPEIYQLK